ncbi:glycosyltransferase family 2 protein [Chloroflexota bacterium]
MAHWQFGLVSVVLVNWNGASHVEGCLNSLLAQTWPSLEIILVDNASTDESLKLARSIEGLGLRVIENPENVGFAQANNQGIHAARGEFVLFLNIDAELDARFIEYALGALAQDEKLGSVTGKLYLLKDGSRTDILDSTGVTVRTSRRAHDRGHGQRDTGQFDDAREVFGACAAAALYRRTALESVAIDGEYFDSTFFMYLEDVDLAWRALIGGWECRFVPCAIGWHVRGGSGGGSKRDIQVHHFKNHLLLVLKNDRIRDILRDFIPVMSSAMADVLTTIMWPHRLSGIKQVLRALPRVCRWRRIIQSKRSCAADTPRRYFSPGGTMRSRWVAFRNKGRRMDACNGGY